VPLARIQTNAELMEVMFDTRYQVVGQEVPIKLKFKDVIFVMEDVDADGSGAITAAEWQSAVEQIGYFGSSKAIFALLDNSVLAQDPSKEPGDVGDGTFVQPGKIWVRYDDTPGFSGKQFKLNVERNNGRAAMMGIFGNMIHEGLTGNPVWPIPVPPQPILEIAGDDVEKGPARVGSFVLVSLGMAFAGITAAVPEFQKRQ